MYAHVLGRQGRCQHFFWHMIDIVLECAWVDTIGHMAIKKIKDDDMASAIRELREERQWTQEEMAERLTRAGLKLTRTAIVAREAGRTRIKAGELRYYAKVFSLSAEQLDEKILTFTQRAATVEGRIPVINRGLAGAVLPIEDPLTMTSHSQSLEFLDRGQVRDAKAVAVIMPDASLAPAVMEGEYLVLIPCVAADVESGRIVLVQTERRMHLGRLYQSGVSAISLRHDNPEWPAVTIKHADIKAVYRGVERRTTAGMVPTAS